MAAVAPAQDGRAMTVFPQKLGEKNHRRGLAGSAHGEVAHADDRAGESSPAGGVPGRRDGFSQGDGAAVREGEEAQQERQRRTGLPSCHSSQIPCTIFSKVICNVLLDSSSANNGN